MDKIVDLYFKVPEFTDDVKCLILKWVYFLKKNGKKFLSIDKEVIHRLEFFLDIQKIVSENVPPNSEVYLYELQKNPENVLKFMKVSLHILLFHFLELETVELESKSAKNQNKQERKEKNSFFLDENYLGRVEDLGNEALVNELRNNEYKNSFIFQEFFFSTKVTIYLYNWNKKDRFENIKSEKVNQLVCLRGSVLRISPIRLLVTSLNFLCEECKSILTFEFVDGKFESPKVCINECKGKQFFPIRESAKSVEYQTVILKENEKDSSGAFEMSSSNMQMLTVNLEISKFFVNSVFPGNNVEVLGILKVISMNTNYLINGKNALFSMYVDCLSVFPISMKKHLSNDYFSLLRIREAKRKVYSTTLWESYIDKIHRKILYAIEDQKDSINKASWSLDFRLHSSEEDIIRSNSLNQLEQSQNNVGLRVAPDQCISVNEPGSFETFSEKKDESRTILNEKKDTFNYAGFMGNFSFEKFQKVNYISNPNLCLYGDYVNDEKTAIENINIDDSEYEFNDSDELDNHVFDFIQDFYVNEPNKFYLLVSSFCPRVVMSYYVKAGLLLSLLGGKTLYEESGASKEIKRRGNVHCLLIGDPGMGKSRILRYVTSLVDNGIFLCSTSTSVNGLTATAVRDVTNHEFAIEGGALVLADKGICCVDELDKISLTDQQAFLECMENQSINITKAGIVCNLKARCSIMAASNPKDGKYNFKKSIYDNIKISFPLISRFDLVFLLTDYICEDKDQQMSDLLINLGKLKYTKEKNSDETERDAFLSNESFITKCKRIKEKDYLPLELLGHLIKYSRRYIHPVLTEDAKRTIKEFYLRLRNLASEYSEVSVPITIRQLESIIRLCQGRARAELSSEVTLVHVQEVIEIYQRTIFYPLFLKEVNHTSKPSKHKSRGKSVGSLSKTFKVKLIDLARKNNNKISKKELRDLAHSIIIEAQSEVFEEVLINMVNNEGFILYKGDYWQVDSYYLR